MLGNCEEQILIREPFVYTHVTHTHTQPTNNHQSTPPDLGPVRESQPIVAGEVDYGLCHVRPLLRLLLDVRLG